MNTHTSTPDLIPTYIREYEDAANDLMVMHMARMMGLSDEEATAFVAMHQSVLEPFLRSVSPPPRPPTPPTPPTPEPLPVPSRYNNLSPPPKHYELLDSEAFPLPLPAPVVPPVEDHISYPLSPIYHLEDDLDQLPSNDWPSNPPSPMSTSSSDNVPVLQAFIEATDDPVEARIGDTNLVQDMALVLYKGSHQLDVTRMNASADEEHTTPTPDGPQPGVL